ncbi:MAG TPA: hypothetical protein PK867_25350 [Pirellulales bacterium]|nr:hypothetical protein [Pirellulales bacterium]
MAKKSKSRNRGKASKANAGRRSAKYEAGVPGSIGRQAQQREKIEAEAAATA